MSSPVQVEVDKLMTSLCSTGHTDTVLTGLLVQLLRYQFSSPDNLENEQIKHLLWDVDIDKSKILIKWVWDFDPQTVGQRPAVLVRLDGSAPAANTVGYGRVHGVPLDSQRSEPFVHFDRTTAILMVLSPEAAQASVLADEIKRYIRSLAAQIRNDLKLLRLQWTRTGPVQKVEECAQHFVVPVVFELGWQDAQAIRAEGPPAKTISIDVGS